MAQNDSQLSLKWDFMQRFQCKQALKSFSFSASFWCIFVHIIIFRILIFNYNLTRYESKAKEHMYSPESSLIITRQLIAGNNVFSDKILLWLNWCPQSILRTRVFPIKRPAKDISEMKNYSIRTEMDLKWSKWTWNRWIGVILRPP